MISPLPLPAPRPPSSLDASLDVLMRRVEHAPTLRERQAAVDTLFAHRRGDTPTHLVALSANPTTRRDLP
jgi:hypothetical protein